MWLKRKSLEQKHVEAFTGLSGKTPARLLHHQDRNSSVWRASVSSEDWKLLPPVTGAGLKQGLCLSPDMVVMSAGSDVVFAYVSTTCVPEEAAAKNMCCSIFDSRRSSSSEHPTWSETPP